MPDSMTADAPPKTTQVRTQRRRRLFGLLAIVIVAVGLLWLLYWLLVGSHQVTTDDAYVNADVAQVTALVSGPIVQSPVGDTQFVRQGQVVAVIDPADYRLAVDQATAQLGQAERRVRQYFANDDAMVAQTDARVSDIGRADAQLAAAQSDLSRANAEYQRRERLAGSGAVSADELTEAQNRKLTAEAAVRQGQSAVAQAKANATAANAQREAAKVMIAGADVAGNPEVAAARAKLNQARLDLERAVVRAPVDGIVARHDIEIGQRVQAGAQLMQVVPVQTAYVDANFKEVQLRKIHVGSDVTLVSDLYGRGVKFHGKVVGLAGGSGSAFSLIPAQNATGNWIKVVQRLPVRIALDPKELQAHPLRVGLSMKATVHV